MERILPHDLPRAARRLTTSPAGATTALTRPSTTCWRWHARGRRRAGRPTRAWSCRTLRACTRPLGPGGYDLAGPARGARLKRRRAVDVWDWSSPSSSWWPRRTRTPLGPPYWTGLRACSRKALWTRASRARALDAAVGIDVQVVERNPADRGFVPQPKRWWWSRRSASCPSTGAWPRLRARLSSSARARTGRRPT